MLRIYPDKSIHFLDIGTVNVLEISPFQDLRCLIGGILFKLCPFSEELEALNTTRSLVVVLSGLSTA